MTSREVKNRSLLGKDLRFGQLTGAPGALGSAGSRGDAGSKGAIGAKGPAGPTGPPGRLATAEAWHPAQFSGTQCSTPIGQQPDQWGNYGYGFATVGFYKDAFGVVHTKGLAVAGSTAAGCPDEPATIFSLPQEYRPAKGHIFTVWAKTPSEGFARVDVLETGEVVASTGSSGGRVPWGYWYSLDGISFRAGP